MTLAARLVAHGRPLEVIDVTPAPPGPDDVLVDLAWAGVNPVDRYNAEGRVAPEGPLPRTLGGEAAGWVDGRPVVVAGAGLGSLRDGVWAQAAVVPRAAVVDVPAGVDLQMAGSVGIVGVTAWNTVRLADVGAGDRVLVLGASGGVGLPLVGLAASTGATVWGQTRSSGKVQAVRDQGAASVVVADASSLHDAVAEFEPTVVFDSLGDGFTPAALGVMAPHGRLVVFGTSAGADVGFNLQQVYRDSLRILGYGGLRLGPEERRRGLAEALAAMADGRLRIPVGRVVPLADVNEALAGLADHRVAGKVVLDLS